MLVQVLRTNREQNFGKIQIRSLGKSLKSVQMQRLGAKIARMYIPFGFLGLEGSEALQQVKKSNMEKGAIKDLVYGGLEEIINNRRYYYSSSVGLGYSHFTDEGKVALSEFMDLMAYKIKEAETADLDRRAKQQVLDQLKKKD